MKEIATPSLKPLEEHYWLMKAIHSNQL